jgi:hypothetical protein
MGTCQSDRINKQISSLSDILIKLKPEINAILETPLAVLNFNHRLTDRYLLICIPAESSVSAFRLTFFKGIIPSTIF